MTKKEYKQLARTLRSVRYRTSVQEGATRLTGIDSVILELSQLYDEVDGDFDPGWFIRACKMNR